MKKIVKILSIFVLATCLFVLGACDPEQDDGPIKAEIEGKTEVHTVTDTREAVYGVYDGSGVSQGTYKSLYEAIDACVNEGDEGTETTEPWYVAKTNDTVKLFVNHAQYRSDSKDMFWFYENGTSLVAYDCWQPTYWNNARNLGNAISIMKSGEGNGLSHYANSWDLMSIGSAHGSNATAVWNSCWQLEASATVDMIAYSGITKETYTINLSEARIAPAMGDGTKTYAYVGFITADGYNTSNLGLACDTTTGNWYYYSGETAYDSNNIVIDTDNVYLTSTWDETEQCFRPDGDVVLTCELLTLEDSEGDEYIVHRVTADFDDKRQMVKDYEISQLTNCGTIRFTSGLDIQSEISIPDYMNGSYFKNLVVTSAKGYVDAEKPYDNVPVLDAGEYDLLNSNPESVARFHTIIYNPACVEANFATAGKDVYSYNYELNAGESLSETIRDARSTFNSLPTTAVAADKEKVEKARLYWNTLSDYQKSYLPADALQKLIVCEDQLIALNVLTPVVTSVQYIQGEKTTTFNVLSGKHYAFIELAQWGRFILSLTYNIGSPRVVPTDDSVANFSGAFGVYDARTLYHEDDMPEGQWITATAGWYSVVFDPDTSSFVATYSGSEPTSNGIIGLEGSKTVGDADPVEVLLNQTGSKYNMLLELAVGDIATIKVTYVTGFPHAADAETFTVTADKAGWYNLELDVETLTLVDQYFEEEPAKELVSMSFDILSAGNVLSTGTFVKDETTGIFSATITMNAWNCVSFYNVWSVGANEYFIVSSNTEVYTGNGFVFGYNTAATDGGLYHDIENEGNTRWVTAKALTYVVTYNPETGVFNATIAPAA